jgi:hypothetical protein
VTTSISHERLLANDLMTEPPGVEARQLRDLGLEVKAAKKA